MLSLLLEAAGAFEEPSGGGGPRIVYRGTWDTGPRTP